MLSVALDDKMKFERHIANVNRKVSQQMKPESVYTLDSSFLILTTVGRLGISVTKTSLQN